MLALIAGTGDLPPALIARLPDRPLICALHGFDPAVTPDVTFRLEQLGSFIAGLRARGIERVCMAGAIRRPAIDPARIDAATAPLVPRIRDALTDGDDGSLRVVIALFEEAGLKVIGAHEIAPDLLPEAGVPTKAQPAEWHRADAEAGERAVAGMGAADTGQACVVRVGKVAATEGPAGTDAMLAAFHAEFTEPPRSDNPLVVAVDLLSGLAEDALDRIRGRGEASVTADDGILFKAPKPGQDRRADLPVIGPVTAMRAAEAGLSGIVIEAGGVMVLERDAVIAVLDGQGMFLWVRPRCDA